MCALLSNALRPGLRHSVGWGDTMNEVHTDWARLQCTWLRGPVPPPLRDEPAYQRILHLVSQELAVPVRLMCSVARSADVTLARHIAFYLAHRTLGWSMPRISGLARRGAAAVCSGIHRVDARCQQDRAFAVRIGVLAHKLASEQRP